MKPPISLTGATGIQNRRRYHMAIKGLSELLKKHKDGTIDDAQFEAELNKALPEDWIPKSKYNELNESKKLSDENLKKANATLEELKGKAGLSDEYKAQIDKLKDEAKKAEEAHKATITQMKRDSAIESALTSAKARNTKAVRALLDEGKLVLNDDGTLSGIKEQIEAVKKDNAFLFDSSDDDNGGGGNGGGRMPFFGGSNPKGGSSGDALRDAMFSAAGLNAPKG